MPHRKNNHRRIDFLGYYAEIRLPYFSGGEEVAKIRLNF